MTDDPNLIAILLTRLTTDLRTEWADLVDISIRIVKDKQNVDEVASAVAKASKCGVESIRRKILAIQHAQASGLTQEQILSMGQEKVLSKFQEHRKAEQRDQQVWFKIKVPGILRDLLTEEKERICKVLKLKSERFGDWLYSHFQQLSTEELKHDAGEGKHAATETPSAT